jgi:hypothetical protein
MKTERVCLVLGTLAACLAASPAGPPAASALHAAVVLPVSVAGLIDAAVALVAGLSAGLVTGLLGRRRFRADLAACGSALEHASARLDAASYALRSAADSTAPVLACATDAARESTLQAAVLAREFDRLAGALPEVLAGAIDRMEARRILTNEAAGLLLDDQVMAVAQAVSGLARVEGLVARLQDIAASLADCAAATAQPGAGALPDEDASEHVAATSAQAQALNAAIARAEGLAGLLPDITATLAAAASRLRRESTLVTQVLATERGVRRLDAAA